MNNKFNFSQKRKNHSAKNYVNCKKSYISMKIRFKFLNRK